MLFDVKKKRLFFFQQRYWGLKIGHPIAKRFYNNGAIIGGLTFKQDLHQFYIDQKDVKYSWLLNHDPILNNPSKYLGNTEISLEDICKDLQIQSIWPYVQSLRNYVKSYRDKYYYGFKQNVSDENIILYIKSIYKLLINIKKEFNPDIFIIPNFVGLVHIMTFFFAKKNNIKIIAVTHIEKNTVILINDITESTGSFFDRVEFYNKTKETVLLKKRSAAYLKYLRQNFLNSPINFFYKDNYFKNFLSFAKKISKIIINLHFFKIYLTIEKYRFGY